MDEQDKSPTSEDFEQTPWQSVLETVAASKDYEYANAFHQAAEDSEKSSDARAEGVYRLLADLCSFVLHPEHPRQPFRSTQVGAFRTSDPEGISSAAVSALGIVAPTVPDPWLRARMADFVWTFGRNHQMARLAIESYIEIAKDIAGAERWPSRMHPIERAVEIARQLGPKGGAVEEVTDFVDSVLSQVAASPGMLAHALLTLAVKHRLGDPLAQYVMASDIANNAERENNWDQAERYWQLAEDFAGMANDPDKRSDALGRQGDCYLKRAKEIADLPHIGKLRAVKYLERAVEAFRRARMPERSEEVQRLMLEYQRAIPGELIPMRSSIPIGDAVQAARDAVSGKPLEEALLALALLMPVPEYSQLRHQAEKNVDRFVFRRLFPAEQLNAQGRVVGREEALNPSTPDGREAAIQVDMAKAATNQNRILAQAVVIPALNQISEEHLVRTEHFFWLVSNNPLVPAGREWLYAQAFQAAFEGDIAKATHILVLQVEHSIRELLDRKEVLVTSLKDGIQMERGLNQLLYRRELREVLGDDFVFGLQCLLIDKFGSDLRNRVAHGLMDSAAFNDPECFYCWWFCFRLVCEPILATLQDAYVPNAPEDAEVKSEGDDSA
ncbi:MAG TPA: DUF4209 domain-containing protein [Longimicrobium sp.]|uniref:DUF4209 domain-containing protein n=1 Tax=Longimicrobium sp. TaxID=2029185 RepID=UPI002EDACA85